MKKDASTEMDCSSNTPFPPSKSLSGTDHDNDKSPFSVRLKKNLLKQ